MNAERDDPDTYASVGDGPDVTLNERGSIFRARARAAATRERAEEVVAEFRRREHDATHHVFAWRLGPPDAPLAHAADDGEPAGTSGPPVLAAIEGRGVFDVVVVVTRWFGGTKLGTGGLIRAYGRAAAAALDAAPPRVVRRSVTLEVRCAFDDVGAVEAVLARAGAAVRATRRSFDAGPLFRVAVAPTRAGALERALADATAGRARLARVPDDASPG